MNFGIESSPSPQGRSPGPELDTEVRSAWTSRVAFSDYSIWNEAKAPSTDASVYSMILRIGIN
jgi:hypothetical protein